MRINRDTIIKMFSKAEKGNYAIPHFNHSDYWDMSFIVKAAQLNNSPVIVASLPRVVEFYGLDRLCALMTYYAKDTNIPIVHHLDHCHDIELCKKAVDAGFTSVMIDAADMSIEDNIRAVKTVTEYAHPRGVFVEAEIGKIKQASVVGYTPEDYEAGIEDALRLVNEAHPDSLAVSIGSEHGWYQHKPKLDYELLDKLHQKLDLPLVLHGGSGIPYEDVEKAVSLGIRKVNVGTEIRYTYLKTLQASLEEQGLNAHSIDIFTKAEDATVKRLTEWMTAEGCIGKASDSYE